MAVQVVQRYIDDIDGELIPEEEVQHVVFSVGRKRYEMHLSPANREKFDEQMQFYIDHARELKLPGAPKTKGKKALPAATAAEIPAITLFEQEPTSKKRRRPGIKAWAEANGYGPLPKMGGRVPDHIVDAYDEAHP